MTMLESFYVALFCISVVFSVLASLFAMLKLFSFVIGNVNVNGSGSSHKVGKAAQQERKQADSHGKETGRLILKGIDEPTAAIVMATVSDDLKVPLSKLSFKSIKIIK